MCRVGKLGTLWGDNAAQGEAGMSRMIRYKQSSGVEGGGLSEGSRQVSKVS